MRHRQGRQRPGGCRLGVSLEDTAAEGGEEEEAEDDLLLWIGYFSLPSTCAYPLSAKANIRETVKTALRNLGSGFPITSTEIETVIRNLPTTKAQDQMASQLNSTKNLEKS